MSEYWLSNKKYFCRSCRIYVQDNKASRNFHESGNRHKNAVAEELRNLYRKKDEEKIKSQRVQDALRRVDEAAHRQYDMDLKLKRRGEVIPGIEENASSTSRWEDRDRDLNQYHYDHHESSDEVQDEEPKPEDKMGIIGEWVRVESRVESPFPAQLPDMNKSKLFKKAHRKHPREYDDDSQEPISAKKSGYIYTNIEGKNIEDLIKDELGEETTSSDAGPKPLFRKRDKSSTQNIRSRC